MPMLKVIEVVADSALSWEDAAQQAVSKASESLDNVKSVYVKDHSAKVENGSIVGYRINAIVSFILDEDDVKITST